MHGHIFLCSNATEDECLQRQLFGGGEKYQSKTGKIEIGDPLFLYNYVSKRLHGKFKAASPSQLNIVPEAWEGKFPWQVKVSRDLEYKPISKTDFEKVIPFQTIYPLVNLSVIQVEQLENIFKSEQRLPVQENEFRNMFPAKYFTDDGHHVRSLGEVIIDNWLFKQFGLQHGYERKIPIEEIMFCDFFIKAPEINDCIYTEYWGLEDKKYLERKEHKIALYKKHNLKLIELTPKDLENIDDVMPSKLRIFLKGYKFQ